MTYSDLKILATTMINHPELSIREKEKIHSAILKDNHKEVIGLYNKFRKKIAYRLNYRIQFSVQGLDKCL